MSQKLNQLSVERALPSTTRQELADGGGLYLTVHCSGLKTWAVRYRVGGRSRKYTIPGAWPRVSLKAARTIASEVLERVAAGGDPGRDKIEARYRAGQGDTGFSAVAALFLDTYLTDKGQRPRPRTITETARLFGLQHDGNKWRATKGGLAERWRGRAIADISKGDVIAAWERMRARGVTVNANNLRARLFQLFGWCVRRGILVTNVVAGTDKPAPRSEARERALGDDELALVWRAASEERDFGDIIRFLILTGQRRGEVGGATWSEIDFDQRLWNLPKGRTKNGHAHSIPLSAAAIALLKARPGFGQRTGLIFSTARGAPITAFPRSKQWLDGRIAELAQQQTPALKVESWRIHDLRRSVATGLQRLGTDTSVIEKLLNHVSGRFAGIAGVYQRHPFEAEKRAALDAWARHIIAITEKTEAQIIEIGTRKR